MDRNQDRILVGFLQSNNQGVKFREGAADEVTVGLTVCLIRACRAPRPIPDVPPMRMAMGLVGLVAKRELLLERMSERGTPIVMVQWCGGVDDRGLS